MKRHIPNFLTLLNLFAGCVGIVFAFNGDLKYAAYSIWLGAVFDFLDGFSARTLGVSSDIGKELDSLADMVTFGVLPSVILFQLADGALYRLEYLTFSLALFSALRLAKFNIATNQKDHFIGVPTPAAAFFVSGLPFWVMDIALTWHGVLIVAVVLSLLLVAPINMIALKFDNYRLKSNWSRYAIIGLALLLLILLKAKSLPLIIAFYVAISLVSFRSKEQ